MLPPLILAAIKVLSQEARSYTGRALAYGPSHDDILALSRVVSALSANRTAFRLSVSDITRTATNGLKMATAGDVRRVDVSFAQRSYIYIM